MWNNIKTAAQSDNQLKFLSKMRNGTLPSIGFKVLLAWHYLILFSPLLVSDGTHMNSDRLIARQLVLYITLAVSFGVLLLVGKRFFGGHGQPPSLQSFGCVAAISIIASLFAVAVSLGITSDYLLELIATVLLGASEALIMYFWLHFYAQFANQLIYRSLATDMVIGTLLGMAVLYIMRPVSIFIMTAMPLVAVFSLAVNESTSTLDLQSEKSANIQNVRPQRRALIVALLPSLVYALAFGLLQGCFFVGGVSLLVVSSPIAFIGIIIAGIVIFTTSRESGNLPSRMDRLHRYSLLFFTLGVICLMLIGSTNIWGLTFAETSILAGFNLFDFGALILSIGIARKSSAASLHWIDGGRALVYLSLALGLAMGWGITQMANINADIPFTYIIGGIAVLLLIVTVLVSFPAPELAAEDDTAIAPESNLNALSSNCGTHDGLSSGGLTSCSLASNSSNGSGEQTPAETRANAPKKLVHECSRNNAQELITQTSLASNTKEHRAGAWVRACDQVAGLYQLSKREQEILHFVAKGRNAEYVQSVLVISLHTAKTHIANIYRKLDVHSSQDVINFVEEFKQEMLARERIQEENSSQSTKDERIALVG
ncbi:MAG: helix-turn-helix transcriptional regulator [Coriobacteriales bacterium]|jgi:DNA-binding CsgD family transcriptional regulator|nr:helix-turn-helix transcriptional regulator [Coriobacteriales bacterium]